MPLTARALQLIESEGAKAGKTLPETIIWCLEHSWGGFKASWFENAGRGPMNAAPAKKYPAVIDYASIDYGRGINPDGSF